MKKFLYLALLIIGCFATIDVAHSAPALPNNPSPSIMGPVNTHDLDIIKKNELEKRMGKDLQEVQKREEKNKKRKGKGSDETSDSEKGSLDNEPPVIKAKVEEYQTKGVYVEKIKITPSEIFTQKEIDKITAPIVQNNVTFEQINGVINTINRMYAEKGFVTARAFLPPQVIDDGILKIELIEGRVGNIAIEGNKWTRSSYIKKRLSKKPGDLFDITALERDILRFNTYTEGVELKADLSQGEKSGTTDIRISSKETLPFHITGLMDNAGRTTIGLLRGGLMLNTDSLLGYRDKLTIGTYASESSFTPFADYNIPVNKYDGRLGFMFSSSQSKIIHGDYEMFNIESRSYNYSLYYNHPLIRKPFFELNAYTALNYKQATTSFDSYDLYTDKITSAQFSLNARRDTRRGIWYVTQDFYHAFPIIQPESKYFKYSGNIIRLHDFGHGIIGQFRGMYQSVPNDVIPYIDQFQAGGIASVRGYSEGLLVGKSGYLLSAELLFPIAPKTIKVRVKEKQNKIQNVNYFEVEERTGEIVAISEKEPVKKIRAEKTTRTVPFIGSYVKGVLFIDHAGVFPFKGDGPGAEGIRPNDYLISMGPGLRIQLPGDLTARVYWGFPMLNNIHEANTGRNQWGRFHFELSLAPDFEWLLKHRKRVNNL